MKVKVDGFVCKGGELVAEAELVRAVSGGGEGEAVVLFLHLFIEDRPIRILQTTVHIVVTASDHLQKETQPTRETTRRSHFLTKLPDSKY